MWAWYGRSRKSWGAKCWSARMRSLSAQSAPHCSRWKNSTKVSNSAFGGETMPFLAGIDCGTSFTKAVVLSGDHSQPRVLGKGRTRSGVKVDEAATAALEQALAEASLERRQLEYIATTGFARYGVSFRDIQVTEITTAARGAHFDIPETR